MERSDKCKQRWHFGWLKYISVRWNPSISSNICFCFQLLIKLKNNLSLFEQRFQDGLALRKLCITLNVVSHFLFRSTLPLNSNQKFALEVAGLWQLFIFIFLMTQMCAPRYPGWSRFGAYLDPSRMEPTLAIPPSPVTTSTSSAAAPMSFWTVTCVPPPAFCDRSNCHYWLLEFLQVVSRVLLHEFFIRVVEQNCQKEILVGTSHHQMIHS